MVPSICMKLRIRDSSIRLRLTRSEVERLHAGAEIEESVDFGPGNEKFVYLIRPDDDAGEVCADYRHGRLGVRVPAKALSSWALSDDVGLTNNVNGLQIIVEKDFACLKERPGEDESDMFANPAGLGC